MYTPLGCVKRSVVCIKNKANPKLNFKERIANYILGNIPASQLPQTGLAGLEENNDSQALRILAGMNEEDNLFEIEGYYRNTLNELKIKEPSRLEASRILVLYYLKQMVSYPGTAFDSMVLIDNQVYKKMDWSSSQNEKRKYVGEELGLEKLYTWYREIQDWRDGSNSLHYSGRERLEQRSKFEGNLVEEARQALEKMRNN